MSSQTNDGYPQFLQQFQSLSDDEIRRRLIEDHNVQCGPVTAQTKRVLLKKLIKLEQEKNSGPNNNSSFNNGSFVLNNSDGPQRSFTNGNNDEDSLNGSNRRDGVDSENSDDEIVIQDFPDIQTTTTPLLPSHTREIRIVSTDKRQSPMKSVSRQKISTEEVEAIKTFKEVEKTLKQQPAKSEASVIIQKQTSVQPHGGRSELTSSRTTNTRLQEYSSESSDDEKIPKLIKPSSNILKTKTTSGIAMPRVSNESIRTTYSSRLTRAPIRQSTSMDNVGKKTVGSTLLNYSDSSDSESEHTKKDKICQMLLNHRPGLGARMQHQQLKGSKQSSSLTGRIVSFFQKIKQKFSSSAPKPQRKYETIPATATTSSSREDFSTSSNYISLALLLFVILFFIVIFSIYIYSKFTYTSRYSLDLNDYAFIEDKSKLLAPICKSDDDDDFNCLPKEADRKPALNMIKEIKSYIDKNIYEAYCGTKASSSSTPLLSSTLMPEIENIGPFKRVDFEREIQLRILPSYDDDERLKSFPSETQLFLYDLGNAFKLIKLNSAWNLKVDSVFDNEISLMQNYSINLPLQCRLKWFWRSYFWIIISTITSILMATIMFFYYRYSKHVEQQEQELVYDLIEKSIELLQSPDEPQSMPVLHIRDSLLSPAEKKSAKFKRIWNKVVNHIENSESRVKVEYKKIDGEEFKAWKWIATTTNSQYSTDSENDGDYLFPLMGGSQTQTQKIGGVEWQGQAFAFSPNTATPKSHTSINNNESMEHSFQHEMIRNKNFQALTRFLKIRNIFEKEAQYIDSNWSKKIVNTILDKIVSDNGQHDIVHIEIDGSTNEGLVFLKCASMAGATNVFHALHGWWCEKKLVSVKFLKEERYYQRFPHSRNMNTPLQTSNQIL